MGKKIKFTRNELKAQREALARYTRFLPTLELKKMQLEIERRKVVQKIDNLKKHIQEFKENIKEWEKLFIENYPKPVYKLVKIKEVIVEETNIAGIHIPVFKDIIFTIEEYDKFFTPPWFENGIEVVKEILKLNKELEILEEQKNKIIVELRRTTQRINLFKERLIPECKENIRKIRIYLGDVQAAAVGRAKIAKQKTQKRNIQVQEG